MGLFSDLYGLSVFRTFEKSCWKLSWRFFYPLPKFFCGRSSDQQNWEFFVTSMTMVTNALKFTVLDFGISNRETVDSICFQNFFFIFLRCQVTLLNDQGCFCFRFFLFCSEMVPETVSFFLQIFSCVTESIHLIKASLCG